MIVSLFSCSPQALRADPDLGPALRAAGVTHLEMMGLQSLTHDVDQPIWEREWEKYQGADLDWCVANDWRVIVRLDDAFRTVPEREAMRRSRGKIEYAACCIGDTEICDGVEVVDEIQQDPRSYPCDELEDWWYTVGGPPLAYCGHAPQRFEKRPGAKIISRMWNWWAPATPTDGIKGPLRLERLRGSLAGLEHETRPICALIDASGMYGRVGTDGKVRSIDFRKPPSGQNILKQFQTAHEMGATRYRVWAWDSPAWQRNREQAKAGDKVFVGIEPKSRTWKYLAEGIKAIKEMAV